MKIVAGAGQAAGYYFFVKEGEVMKQWAQAFYLSQNWKDTSRAYMLSQDNICERCGEPAKICHHKTYLTRDNINNPAISLCWDNLEALCQDCHNKEHHRTERKGRYKFDAEGNIIYL